MSLFIDTQPYLDPGCTRLVAEFYGHVWGRNRIAWLQIIRAFVVMFIWTGILKCAVATRNYTYVSAGRWQGGCGWDGMGWDGGKLEIRKTKRMCEEANEYILTCGMTEFYFIHFFVIPAVPTLFTALF